MTTPAAPRRRRALTIATVSRSLALQSPEAWQILRRRGYNITFAAARDGWTESLLTPGSAYHELRAERSLRPRGVLELAAGLRALSRQEWDLVQIQSPIISVLWRLVATGRSRRRTVYVVHGFHFQSGERSLRAQAVRLLEAALAHRTLALATVSAADHRFVRGLPQLLHPKLLVALPGAGVPVDKYAALDLPREGSSASAYALFVGDLNANKDPMCAVAAVEECRRRGRSLELTVIGEGHLADDIRTATRTRPWLHLVDRTRAIPSWMAHAQVLLAPSYREGVPRVIIEALAAGTPVVARRNRGSVELLAGGLGEILPTDDPQAWADAVEHVLDSSADTVAMRERAEAYGLDRFRSAYSDLVAQMESKRSLL